MTIHRIDEGSIEVKRFYLPLEIEVECPECGHKQIKDFENEYLSYPNLGDQDLHLCCRNEDEDCWHEWTVPMKLTIEVEVKD